MPRLAVLSSHPIQYYGPLFRRLAERVDLEVFFAHKSTPAEQARAGFGTAFDWDVDLTSGYAHTYLENRAAASRVDRFLGCDTPEIGERLREGRFDALLVQGWHLKSYVQGIMAAKRLGLPVMVRGDSHLGTPRSRLKHVIKYIAYPRLLKLFDAALYVGLRSRAYYKHYGYSDERLFFSPHCVDTERFERQATPGARAELRRQLNIEQTTQLVMFAGKLVPFKRPLDLIAAASICRSRKVPVEVLIAGDGELRHAITDSAQNARIPLHLLGFCNQSRMPAAYVAADVLVLPSDGRETWGLVVNEALASGRPVIVSEACGCAPDLATAGAGHSFAMGDIAALADRLSGVLSDPPLPATIKAVSRRYSLDQAVDGVLEALASVIIACKRKALVFATR